MYRKPRFLEELHAIREEMSREADYDVELFAEMVRSGARPARRRAEAEARAEEEGIGVSFKRRRLKADC